MNEQSEFAEAASLEPREQQLNFSLESAASELPSRKTVEIEGREYIQIGDLKKAAEIFKVQGNNELGFRGTCALASIAGLLRLYGYNVTEDRVVKSALEKGLCSDGVDESGHFNRDMAGGVAPKKVSEIIKGIYPEISARYEGPQSLEHIATAYESGKGVILSVNSQILWGEKIPPDITANHAISLVGVLREAGTEKIIGFWVNDTGPQDGSGMARFVSAALMEQCVVVRNGGPITVDMSGRHSPSAGV